MATQETLEDWVSQYSEHYFWRFNCRASCTVTSPTYGQILTVWRPDEQLEEVSRESSLLRYCSFFPLPAQHNKRRCVTMAVDGMIVGGGLHGWGWKPKGTNCTADLDYFLITLVSLVAHHSLIVAKQPVS
jgi:hypothetical protein